MVRVELISQRVHLVENVVAEVKQTPLKNKGKDASSRLFNDFDQADLKADRSMTEGEVDRSLLHSSHLLFIIKVHQFVNLEDLGRRVNNPPFWSFTSEKS